MPFDSLHSPPEWRSPGRPPEEEKGLTGKERIVAVSIALILAVITLANCRMLLGYWYG